MRLDSSQQQSLVEALRAALRESPDLPHRLEAGLGERLATLVGEGPLETLLESLVQRMDALGRADELIRVTQQVCPAALSQAPVFQQLERLDERSHRVVLEELIDGASPFLDVERWQSRLEEVMRQVCRLELTTPEGTSHGTGFLIGPDLLITNHHVVSRLLTGSVPAESLVARFDYRISEDGVLLRPGVEYRLAREWCIAQSPPAPWELDPGLAQGEPTEEHLDIAVLRLSGAPGNERGWLKPPDRVHPFQLGTPLYILQHPESRPLKLAMENKAVLKLNAARTRVRYCVNTLRGSSGSPCFNTSWELVAIHHSGTRSATGDYNEGIPFDTVARTLGPVLQAQPAAGPVKRGEYKPVPRPALVERLASKVNPGKLLLLAPRRGGARTLAEAVARKTGLAEESITWLMPPRVDDCSAEAYFSELAPGAQVKDSLSWSRWMRDTANRRHHLIVLLHDGGPAEHVRNLGKALRALLDEDARRFSFLAAGGERCARLRYDDQISIFFGIGIHYVPDLTEAEVGELLVSMNEDRRLAPMLHAATGGHPGLLHEVLCQEEPLNAETATRILVRGPLLQQVLRIRLNAEARAEKPPRRRTRDVLLKLLKGEKVGRLDESTADDFKYPEVRLYYDGIVRSAPDGSTVFRCEAARIVAEQGLQAGEEE